MNGGRGWQIAPRSVSFPWINKDQSLDQEKPQQTTIITFQLPLDDNSTAVNVSHGCIIKLTGTQCMQCVCVCDQFPEKETDI